MKEWTLRKWHRWLAIVISPFLVLQAISGMVLSIDWLFGIHQRVGEVLALTASPLARLWDTIFITIHYGLGVVEVPYHTALGITTVMVGLSGFMIFLKVRKRQNRITGGT